MQHRNEGVFALRNAIDLHARESDALRRRLRLLRWVLIGVALLIARAGR